MFPIDFVESLVQFFPGFIGGFLRRMYWKTRLGSMGKGCVISSYVQIDSPENVFLGNNVRLDSNVTIIAGISDRADRKTHVKSNPKFTFERGEVHLGNSVHIATGSVINGIGGVSIGNDSCLSSGCKAYSFSHHYRNLDMEDGRLYSFSSMSNDANQFMISGPISIGAYCAIGLNAVIFPGVHIGDGAWIEAGYNVTTNINSKTVAKSEGFKDISDLNFKS